MRRGEGRPRRRGRTLPSGDGAGRPCRRRHGRGGCGPRDREAAAPAADHRMLEAPRNRGHIRTMSEPSPPSRSLLLALAIVIPALVLVVGAGFGGLCRAWASPWRKSAGRLKDRRNACGRPPRGSRSRLRRRAAEPREIAFAGPSGRAMTLADFRAGRARQSLGHLVRACREEMPALDHPGRLRRRALRSRRDQRGYRNPEKPKAWLQNGIQDRATTPSRPASCCRFSSARPCGRPAQRSSWTRRAARSPS